MMTSMNTNNKSILPRRPNSPGSKLETYRTRSRLVEQQDAFPKRAQKDQRSSTTTDNTRKEQKLKRRGSISSNKQKQTTIDSLGPYDVICGRDSTAFNNVGNRRFRLLITMNVDRYNDSEGRHKKGQFIGSLVRTFRREIGAKFYKMKDGQLVELTERQIRQKVGHALRDVLAFQESQQQQQQQEQQEQEQTESDKTGTLLPMGKMRPWIMGPPRPRSQTANSALSSIRSRMSDIRKEIQPSNFRILPFPNSTPPPSLAISSIPHSSPTSQNSRTPFRRETSVGRNVPNFDSFGNQGTAAPNTNTFQSPMDFSYQPDYSSTSANGGQHQQNSEPSIASEFSQAFGLPNKNESRQCHWNNAKSFLENSNSYASYNNTSQINCDSSNNSNIGFDQQQPQQHTGDPFEDMDDLMPIPIDDQHDQNEDVRDVFEM